MSILLLDFPAMFQTERLQVRKPFPGDGAELYEAVRESVSHLRPWLPIPEQISSEEQAEQLVREEHARFLLREQLSFHIYEKDSGQLLGAISLIPTNWDIPKFELRFWTHSRYTRKGYMEEAVRGAVQFAFFKLRAKRLEIRCDSLNEAACSLAAKLGFALEGVLRNDRLAPDTNELRHTSVYAKTDENR
ncbi:GNAT family N-acetyltransferase [Ectobacillus ponti]|uniref:GNAT family N-acetyltransferase n=1 Tax=Ectobacillus ponti TaxID=2961894 RepID=A0AA41X5E3_9BACI|nr:GNAT family N-acetyltransferase [Ectobacillus ponti]MCP8966964.1 GNAT family N-acetyltransferase [Ectobacillus ponti]